MPIDAKTLARYRSGVFVETGAGTCGGSKAALELGFPRIPMADSITGTPS